MKVNLYPCCRGWTQFYSTNHYHWCRVPGAVIEGTKTDVYYGYISVKNSTTCAIKFDPVTLIKTIEEKFLMIVDNKEDVPSSVYVDFMGYIRDIKRWIEYKKYELDKISFTNSIN